MRRIEGSILLASLLTLSGLLSGCASSEVTAARLDQSISRTFANLYLLQQSEQGSPSLTRASLGSSAVCTKGATGSPQRGAGNDWVCDITYYVYQVGKFVTVIYNVNAQTDGCYAADPEGPASVTTPLGQENVGDDSRTITGAGGRLVLNPLWLIDGCLDIG
jgi:hypothetical protein